MTHSMPLVSAVIPVYNGERFIADAIGSVLDQTYPVMECIVVNDGSTDRTDAVIRRFDSQVRILTTPNCGVAHARNIGASAANGNYLAFLDADDLWKPDKVRRQVAVIEELGAAMVYTGIELIDEAGVGHGAMDAPPTAKAVRNTLLLEPPPISIAQSALIRREVFRAVGGFDERLSTSADCDLACRIGLRYKIAALDEPLAAYRQHADQMHNHLDALDDDMRLVHAKLFGSPGLPEELRRLRRRARANVNLTLAAAYWHRDGHRHTALLKAGAALLASPKQASFRAASQFIFRYRHRASIHSA